MTVCSTSPSTTSSSESIGLVTRKGGLRLGGGSLRRLPPQKGLPQAPSNPPSSPAEPWAVLTLQKGCLSLICVKPRRGRETPVSVTPSPPSPKLLIRVCSSSPQVFDLERSLSEGLTRPPESALLLRECRTIPGV